MQHLLDIEILSSFSISLVSHNVMNGIRVALVLSMFNNGGKYNFVILKFLVTAPQDVQVAVIVLFLL